ncbi:MAG: ATP-binding cassette domain-containing protein [Methyloligellaceae bacterium]
MQATRRIPHALKGKRRIIFVRLCAIALAQVCLAAGTAFLIRYVFDAIEMDGGRWPQATVIGLGILALIAIAMAWCKYAERTTAETLGQSYVHTVRLRLFDHLSEQPPRQLQSNSRGGHLLRFIGDLGAIRKWISLGLARLSVALIMTAGSLTALSFINLHLAVTVTAAIIAGGIVSLILGNRMRDAARLSRRNRARLAGDINERISLMPVVQAFSQVSRERRRVARKGRTLRESMIARAEVIGGLRGVSELVTGLSLVAILAVGGIEIGAARASAGSLLAAMSILGMLTPALRDLSRSLEYWHTNKIAVARIEAFLSKPTIGGDEDTCSDLVPGTGCIEFDDVHVDGGLKGITAIAEAGSIITIIGPNGGGKTTLLSLVSRFVEPTSGRVLIDGQDISSCTIKSLRAMVGIVSADLPLMRGTIKRNICYRRPNITSAELERVCDLCGITDILADFPQGLETRVFECGANLSLGQRQRIALARALIGKPKILLLDEADANLDPRSTGLIDKVLGSFKGTAIIISHRAERIAQATRIWHVADGKIVESGTAPDLLSRDGPTFRLLSEVIQPLRSADKNPSIELACASTTIPQVPSGQKAGNRRLDRVQVLTSSAEPRCPYLLYVPESVNRNLPVLVTVHGISCNEEEHIDAFSRYAERFGFIVVAPVFSADDFRGYQRFGHSKRNPGQRSDLALLGIMDDVAKQTGHDTRRFLLYGHSGGGQFAHRFAMAYPDRVISVAVSAPGWFTFPSRRTPFPRGLNLEKTGLDLEFDSDRFLRVPMAVCVGEADNKRDSALNTSANIDSQQGKTRHERGQRWVHAMRRQARNSGFDTKHEFIGLSKSAHAFEQCVNNGQLIEYVLKFFQLDTTMMPTKVCLAQYQDSQRQMFFAF